MPVRQVPDDNAPLWLPLLQETGDLDRSYVTPESIAELEATSDRYLAPALRSMQRRGTSTTTPSRHCGPTFQGASCRTLTMTDLITRWTENTSIRNNAAKWIVQGVDHRQALFPFPLRVFDSDNGSAFINHTVVDWMQARDIAQTRSRLYRKNDQATVESKKNHVIRTHVFHWSYDAPEELALLGQLWPLVSLRLNSFLPPTSPARSTGSSSD